MISLKEYFIEPIAGICIGELSCGVICVAEMIKPSRIFTQHIIYSIEKIILCNKFRVLVPYLEIICDIRD
jgi:hypothetical protein